MPVLRDRVSAGGVGSFALPAAALAALVALLVAAAQGTTLTLVAVGIAAFLVVVAVLGTERTGTLLLIGAYATAPMYKGLTPNPEAPVTPTDLLMVGAFTLLLPRLLRGTARLPGVYFGGVALVLAAGLVSSAFSDAAAESFLALGFWMAVMLGLPVAIAAWGPSAQEVHWLAWAFVGGQVVSTFWGLVSGPYIADRYAGLASHPNYFAQSGLFALALLLYLGYRMQGKTRALVAFAVVVCAASVLLSGSRAATVVVAVLVLMVPIVERSALIGFVVAAMGALVMLTFSLVVEVSAPGSSIARLGGDQSAQSADSARAVGLEEGVDRFFSHPLRGDGLTELFDIHNNFLEVAVAIGVFGLAGYLMVLYAFARPLFGGGGEYRRLTYAVWAYIGFGATVPSLYDRSIWAVVALSVVAMVAHSGRADTSDSADPSSAGSSEELAPPNRRIRIT